MKLLAIFFGCITLVGVGFGIALAFYWADNPSIIIRDRWRTVTTAPPVTYVPETPFHIDPQVVCPTTTTTRPPSTTTTTVPETTSTTAVTPG